MCENLGRLRVVIWRVVLRGEVVALGVKVWVGFRSPASKENADAKKITMGHPFGHDMRLSFRRFHRQLDDGEAI